jgi:hypothetical protein
LTYTVASSPFHGALTGKPPTVTYTPAANYQGNDSFTFIAGNGVQSSGTTIVTLLVAPGTPVAGAQSVNVPHNTPAGIILTGSDPDSPALPLTYALATSPSNGVLSGAAPNLIYTPSVNYHGPDGFTFTAGNGVNTAAAATISISVAAGTPIVNSQSLHAGYETPTGITLTGSDPDVPALALTYAVAASPSHGTLTGSAPSLTYTPAAGYQGGDSFTFTASNGSNTSASGTVSIAISVSTPTANPQTVTAGKNMATAITLAGTDTDVPALPLTYTVATSPSEGALTGAAPNLTYTPNTSYTGSDSFTFTVTNGVNTSAPATVSIIVTTYTDAAGTYNGLAQPSVTGTGAAGATDGNALSGLIRLTSAKSGKFSGKLDLGGVAFPLKGHFDQGGAAHFGSAGATTLSLAREGQPPLTLALKLALAAGTDKLNGALSLDGATVAAIDADRALYTASKHPIAPFMNVPAGLPGNYTLIIAARTPADQGLAATAFPQGDGIATLSVRPNGVAVLSGFLADGTRFDYANHLSKTNTLPIYIPLARGKGSISVQAIFENLPGSDLDGSGAHWYLPAQPKSAFYPNGWPNGILVDLIGSKLVIPTPANSASILPGLSGTSAAGNADIDLMDGDIPSPGLAKAVNVSTNNQIAVITPAADKLSLKMAPSDGLLTGAFIDPATGKPDPIHGAIFQKQSMGFGFFLGGAQSGSFSIAPR